MKIENLKSASEISDIFGIHVLKIYRFVAEKQIPYYFVNNKLCFDVDEIKSVFELKNTNMKPKETEKIVPLPRMAEILNITPTRMKLFAERGDVPYEVVNNEMLFEVQKVMEAFK